MSEASPICRGKNLTVETVLALVNAIPRRTMRKTEFMQYGETRLKGWTQTHSQIARQMALYYEDDQGNCHPRFTSNISREKLFMYACNWAELYFIPNLYTPSLKAYKNTLTNIYSFLKYQATNGETSYSNACRKIFGIEMNNLDKVRVYLNSFTDLIIDEDKIKLNDSLASISEYDIHPNIEINNAVDYFNYFNMKNDNSQVVNSTDSLQQIYYGAPGTGKSYTVKLFTKGESVVRTTFHPDSDYSTFVGAYKPTTKQEPRYTSLGDKAIKMKDSNGDELMEDRIVYEFVAQAFLQAYVQAWKNYAEVGEEGVPKKQFLVVEEINRGNCAQIFGDLFQLLDRNYSSFSEYYIHADKDMQAFLSKAFEGKSIAQKDKINKIYEENVVDRVLSGEILLLPNNLYIYATMNTSDQSLFPIDSAFKRRWDWIYVPIANVVSENWKIEVGSDKYDWWDFVQKINKHIYETTNSADKQLGYFFCKAKNKIVSTETFVNKVVFYLWNDVFKDYGFDSSIFNDEKDENGKETKLSFDKFYRLDDGKTIVVESKVAKFLDNLGVVKVVGINPPVDDILEDEEDSEETLEVHDGESSTANGPQRDYSKYSINGVGNYNKRTAVRRVIEMYVGQNPQMTGEQIINVWKGLNLALPNAVESEAEYLAHTANDSVKRGNPIQVHENDVIYVSNQLNVERMNDFISKVNQQDWGIHIEKVSD